jgi:hypothetical protein
MWPDRYDNVTARYMPSHPARWYSSENIMRILSLLTCSVILKVLINFFERRIKCHKCNTSQGYYQCIGSCGA